MTEQDQQLEHPSYPGRLSGAVILGVLFVAAGAVLLLDRIGLLPAAWSVILWPVLLAGYGVARLSEPRASGRRGSFFLIVGLWWLAGAAGWLSLADTWPVLIVAAGVSMVVEASTAAPGAASGIGYHIERRHSGAGWLVPVILIGALLSANAGRRTFEFGDASHGQFHSLAVMSKRHIAVPTTALTGGEMIVVMGNSSLDLRQVTIPPGTTPTVNVVTMMGEGTITVPKGWLVDVQAVPIMGHVGVGADHDDNDWSDGQNTDALQPSTTGAADAAVAPSGSAPRLTIKGVVMMGKLSVKS